MTKQEFENMVGKEVTCEVFATYNAMYMATPESVTKQAFCAMLDTTAIPESPDAIARRAENARLLAEIKAEINALTAEIKYHTERAAAARDDVKYWRTIDSEYSKSCKFSVTYHAQQVAQMKNRRAALRALFGV